MITAKVNIKVDGKRFNADEVVPKEFVNPKNEKYFNIPKVELEDLKIDELKSILDKKGVKHTTKDNKDDLIEKIRGSK